MDQTQIDMQNLKTDLNFSTKVQYEHTVYM